MTVTTMTEKKKQAQEALKTMYQAAVCAVCQCDNNPEGVYPCDCDCKETENRDRILRMLLKVYTEEQKKIE